MITILCVAAALCAIAAIAAEWNERRHGSFYLLKPLTTLLIIGIALCGAPSEYRQLVLLALVLSLAGDVCLMFEGDGWFIGGLGSFLVAHVLFVAAFAHGIPGNGIPWWSAVFVLYGIGFFGWLLPKTGKLMPAVIIYGIALLSMAIAASARWATLLDARAELALAGAVLFIVSDSSLAVRKFSGPYA
ncbi:MAG TPA: lysoplasmalogenase, partial [Nevskiaceae bacterium]|nr:lysoplasmalogenase [Nevskiaceae bacterium]